MADTVDSPPLFEEILAEPRLPGYSPTSATRLPIRQVEHILSLNSSGGSSWLNLKLKSCAASSQAAPLFHQGDLGVVRGEVSINPAELSKVKSITVVLCGERTVVGQDKSPSFLDLRTELWNANVKWSSGPWKFELVLPEEVRVKEYGAAREVYDLPPSFSVKTVPSFLEYRLTIEVKRGRFRLNSQCVNITLVFLEYLMALPPECRLDTTIAYVPKNFSPKIPPPHLAALTKNQNLPIPSDSNWAVVSVMDINGTLFGALPITMKVSIAVLPGSTLAIGTFAPVLVILECVDSQALDLFSAPSSIRLRVVQVWKAHL
ncbi:hypothetical protein FRC10_009214 [Ceratobasidium sp. 414]|nr:hypothetical protein FRC10_009214 [Ceratobasidium sp. 414]